MSHSFKAFALVKQAITQLEEKLLKRTVRINERAVSYTHLTLPTKRIV